MAEETGQEKTEEPTSKRLNDAREKGDIPRSRELSATVLLLAAAASAILFGSTVASTMLGIMVDNFALDRRDIFDPARMFSHLGEALYAGFFSLWGFYLLTLLAALLSPIALGGWNFSGQAVQPKGSRLNPLSGLKRMFSLKALIELAKALAKFLLVGSFAIMVLWLDRPDLEALAHEAVESAIAHSLQILGWSFLVMSLSLIIISLIDVPFQLYDYNKKLKMTLQEVKDEMKNTEGKPEVKGRIRQLQREISQRKMMSAVPEADVVITNPTHYAVALKYDQQGGGAPRVVAKGADFVALKIREIAQAHDVPLLSAPPLARALYHAAEIDDEIPAGLYQSVAQVLAYVYQLKRYRQRLEEAPAPLKDDDLDIPEEFRQDPPD
ncbi:MAG: flagellar type III secretion system protein FlhB [Oceanospirillales bacterium]|uniref:Flagellar biosynthetic protein FlhB n=1 Tax=Marinobacterium halophilum TaxID=267374 RepID=A0A2P8ESF9_9GAMM|nr:flagellar biosynthesis protein FlhB [Marinobacterium halophilum]MBR9828778.1 flagellar type III secretion system protein FlhB [Oceanospirillales bacterium]PSL12375.1 flagellar biosynthetic protein FlhB [Marinobacterium halophilum]